MPEDKPNKMQDLEEEFRIVEVGPEDRERVMGSGRSAWGVHQDEWPGSSAPNADAARASVTLNGPGAGADGPRGRSDRPSGSSAWNQSDTWPGSSAPADNVSKAENGDA